MANAEPAIEVEGLTKRYGEVTAAEDIGFSVEAGEVFGYLGPNGAGKTTTIRCLMGLLRPSEGVCRVLGRAVVAGRATSHEQIGYLPGDFRIWPRLRAGRVLGMLGALGGGAGVVGVAERRAELCERLGLDAGRRVGKLSKGNRQKVGLVYAFQHAPRVLILDEPTSGLDPLARQNVLELIREAAAGGAAVMLSSHDLSEVAAVCGRAAILRGGRMVESATISKIVQEGRRRLKVWFVAGAAVPVESDVPNGVRVLNRGEGVMELAYEGEVGPVLAWLGKYRVERIETEVTTLEDAFGQYYQRDSGMGGVGGVDRKGVERG